MGTGWGAAGSRCFWTHRAQTARHTASAGRLSQTEASGAAWCDLIVSGSYSYTFEILHSILKRFTEFQKERLFLKNEDSGWREKQKLMWVSTEQRGTENNEEKTPMDGSGLRSQGAARKSQGPPAAE